MKRKKNWLVVSLITLLSFSTGCIKEPDIIPLKANETVSPTPVTVKNTPAIEIVNGKDGELTIASIEQGRDLQLYDQGGHCNCSTWGRAVTNLSPQEERKQIKADLERTRQFIWNHWRNKKRGYIRLTNTGKDNATTTHFFIEPDPDNKWIINGRAVTKQGVEPTRVEALEKIFQVSQSRQKHQQITLIFKNAAGKTIDTL